MSMAVLEEKEEVKYIPSVKEFAIKLRSELSKTLRAIWGTEDAIKFRSLLSKYAMDYGDALREVADRLGVPEAYKEVAERYGIREKYKALWGKK